MERYKEREVRRNRGKIYTLRERYIKKQKVTERDRD